MIRSAARSPALLLVVALLGGQNLDARGLLAEPRGVDTARERPSQGEVVRVEVDGGGFVWPEVTRDCDTAFVELLLRRASRRASVQVRGAGVEIVQYLDPSARGKRLINVSPIARSSIAAGERVELDLRKMRIEAGPSRLLCFEDPELEGRRVLVIAPHPDDAEIAAFGIYSTTDADVVTVTAGDAGGFNYRVLVDVPEDHYRLKGMIRTWDSIVVPFLGGVGPERARNLGYYDATLARLHAERPEVLGPPIAEIPRPSYFRELNVDPQVRARVMSPTWPGLVSDLRAEVERVKPQVIVAPHPMLDNHRDHQFTTLALIEALDSPGEGDGVVTGFDEVVVLLYTNHLVGAEPFPWGPRDGIVGLPPTAESATGHRGIYSHPVDDGTLDLKILALEMMHDLRPLDLQERESLGSLWRRALVRTFKPGRKRPNYSYLRRGPRPNELFWVFDLEGLARLRDTFLERTAAP